MPKLSWPTRPPRPRYHLTVEKKVNRWFVLAHDLVTLPISDDHHAVLQRPDPAGLRHDVAPDVRAWGGRCTGTASHIQTATSFKAHLAWPRSCSRSGPRRDGVVVECGCFQGGSATNLSLVCKLADRELVLYDSFEGLPGGREW